MNLDSPVSTIPRVSSVYTARLNRLGIKTIRDLIYHFPFRYDDLSNIKKIAGLKVNEIATIHGEIINIKMIRTFKKKMWLIEALIKDDSGTIRAVWYNQPFLVRTLKKGVWVNLAGKVNYDGKTLFFSNPAQEKILLTTDYRLPATGVHTGRLVPIYPETARLTSRWLRYIIKSILAKALPSFKDFLPVEIKKSQNLIELAKAIGQIHFPKSEKDIETAMRRLGFDELFLIQLFVLEQKLKRQAQNSQQIKFNQPLIKKFVDSLPFKLTNAQRKAAWEILQDLEKPKPMNRLLEGDVGSGKTVVATIAALQTAENSFQVAFMAPTEILTQQHFNEISKLLKGHNLKIGLLTASECKISYDLPVGKKQETENCKKAQFLQQVKNGQIKIIIGTHSLIQEKVKFKNLALVVVDEQHRFGVNQRAALIRGQTQTETPTNAEEKKELLYEDLTYKIRGCIFAVKKNIGLGHKENIYQKALEQELNNLNINFEKEKRIDVLYNNKKIGIYRPDFVIDGKIIIELKTLPFLGNTEKKQIWTYLKGSDYKLALLVNFSTKDIEIERIVYDTARKFPHDSASVQHESALSPHLLSMTATPIPRTLALTIYGDLDLSLLNEMPKGRQKIITKIVSPANRQKAYDFIRQQIKSGRQAFVICPRIEKTKEEPAADWQLSGWGGSRSDGWQSAAGRRNHRWLDVKAVTEEFEKLSKKIFPDLKIAMLHGKLPAKEKEKIMKDFTGNKINILVSTSVVEVGIDIPNASVMMVEGAERFGLAQLYQFKGRVGRDKHQSFCFLFTESSSRTTESRLKAISTAQSGFELAEKDLAIRGPGEFYGTRQWGLPDLTMASLTNVELIQSCRSEAKKLLAKDPELKNYPPLKEKLKTFQANLHLE